MNERLRQIRLKNIPIITQSKMAKLLGIDRRTYSNYENGKREIPAWVVSKASLVFDLPLEYFFKREDDINENISFGNEKKN